MGRKLTKYVKSELGGENMAGQRQPIELVLAKGSKHLTKKEIEERKSSEVKPQEEP